MEQLGYDIGEALSSSGIRVCVKVHDIKRHSEFPLIDQISPPVESPVVVGLQATGNRVPAKKAAIPLQELAYLFLAPRVELIDTKSRTVI